MTPEDKNALVDAFRRRFEGAEVQAEPVNGSGRYRFNVVASHFTTMTQLERQDALWEIVDQTLPRDASLDLSIILAYAPGELAGAEG